MLGFYELPAFSCQRPATSCQLPATSTEPAAHFAESWELEARRSQECSMTRSISTSVLAAALAVMPLLAQTTTTPARRGATPPAKPAAPAPAAPASAAQPAASASSASQYGPGTYALFTTTKGDFIVRFFDQDAPKTVANFVGLATGRIAWKDPRTKAMVHRPF